MCISPVTIRNPKYKNDTFKKSVDKEFITVPCGHCEECQSKRVNDLVVRGYYEWLDCVANGGFALFDTLTFSDLSISYFNDWKYFSRRTFQLFFKRLERMLEYRGYDIRGNLRHILTTEYGSITFRPHAHVIFFSKVHGLTPEVLNEFVVRAWKDVDLDKPIGRNDLSKSVQQRVINSVYGIRYVCKYISKDTSIIDAIKYHKSSELSQFIYNYFLNVECLNFEQIKDYSKWYPVLRQLFLSYKCTHDVPKDFELFNFSMISHGLGLYFLSNATLDDLVNDIVITDQSDKQYTVYSVPSYYLRKKFYNYNKYSKRYIPNENYNLLRSSLDKKMIDSLTSNERKLEDIFNLLSEKQLSCIFIKYGLEINNENKLVSFRSYVDKLLNGRSFEHFAKYVIYFRNVHVSPYMYWLYEGNLDTLDDSFIDLFCEYRNDSLQHDELLFRTDLGINLMPEVVITDDLQSNVTFNQLPFFKDYDTIYGMIKDILYFYKSALAINKRKHLNEIEKYHSALKKSLDSSIIFN